MTQSPNLTFVHWVHGWPQGTPEVLWELFEVRQRTLDPELGRGVVTRLDLHDLSKQCDQKVVYLLASYNCSDLGYNGRLNCSDINPYLQCQGHYYSRKRKGTSPIIWSGYTWNGFWKLYLHVGPVLFAPDVSYPDPEKLFGCQVQTRKTLLITIVTDPLR